MIKNTKLLEQVYPVNYQASLTKNSLSFFINQFWTDIVTPLHEKHLGAFSLKRPTPFHLILMCKVKFSQEDLDEDVDRIIGVRTLGESRLVTYDDKNLFVEFLTERLSVLSLKRSRVIEFTLFHK
jgi:hypothetical protein